MKMLEIRQNDEYLEIVDESVCIYRALFQENTYVLHNSFDRKVAMLSPSKEGFSLFQDKKKNSFDFIFETRNAGHFIDKNDNIRLEGNESVFTFYSGRMLGKDILIGYEDEEFIFQIDMYEQTSTMFLKQPEYAVYAALYCLYFLSNDKKYSPSSTFLSHMPEDMMSFVS